MTQTQTQVKDTLRDSHHFAPNQRFGFQKVEDQITKLFSKIVKKIFSLKYNTSNYASHKRTVVS